MKLCRSNSTILVLSSAKSWSASKFYHESFIIMVAQCSIFIHISHILFSNFSHFNNSFGRFPVCPKARQAQSNCSQNESWSPTAERNIWTRWFANAYESFRTKRRQFSDRFVQIWLRLSLPFLTQGSILAHYTPLTNAHVDRWSQVWREQTTHHRPSASSPQS